MSIRNSATTRPFQAALSKAHVDALEMDPMVVVFGEDVARHGGAFQVTSGLVDRFGPDRVFDVPISEQAFSGMAIGLAMAGYRPIVDLMFADFMLVAGDQIINQAAKIAFMSANKYSCPIVIRALTGPGRGNGPQHSQGLASIFAHIPGLRVAIPGTPMDAYTLLSAAVADNNPTIFLESKSLFSVQFAASEIGNLDLDAAPLSDDAFRAVTLRSGGDLTLVGLGGGVPVALELDVELRNSEGVESEVINLRWAQPLDVERIVASAEKTGRLLVIEEGHLSFGIGAEVVAATVERTRRKLKVRRVASLDVPIPFAPQLERLVFPSLALARAAVEELLRD
jgi:pyruvate/2-oxoglutarate/acetoin dehydrogenase E1 component